MPQRDIVHSPNKLIICKGPRRRSTKKASSILLRRHSTATATAHHVRGHRTARRHRHVAHGRHSHHWRHTRHGSTTPHRRHAKRRPTTPHRRHIRHWGTTHCGKEGERREREEREISILRRNMTAFKPRYMENSKMRPQRDNKIISYTY